MEHRSSGLQLKVFDILYKESQMLNLTEELLEIIIHETQLY